MQIQPYLFFDGHCEEALEFYKKALDAKVEMMMRFREGPQPQEQSGNAAGNGDKIMHAAFRIGEATILASDGQCLGKLDFKGFALSVTAPDDSTAERLFAALGEGGQVQMPLTHTFFSSKFGMVADRFGVSWMVYTQPAT